MDAKHPTAGSARANTLPEAAMGSHRPHAGSAAELLADHELCRRVRGAARPLRAEALVQCKGA